MPPRKLAQNSAGTAKDSPLVEHQFQPGQSGNPGGRPKGLSSLVRQRTADGVLLYDQLIVLATDAKDDRTKLEALKLLAAYGYGTPGSAQVEWDEERVREAAKQLGKDPDEMVRNWHVLHGDKGA